MRRVTGIGGIFFGAKDPKALCAWYKKHLGIDVQDWGGAAFTWTDSAGNPAKGTTAWLIGPADGKHFAPRLMLPLSLSYDHRVIDGASGARFTTFFAQALASLVPAAGSPKRGSKAAKRSP